MRLSCDSHDPGYHPEANLLDIRIVMDGQPVERCVTADSDKGEVWVCLEIPGRVYQEMVKAPGTWTMWRYTGSVEIIENVTERRL